MGNTRLALVDLSKRSNQPLEVGNYLITFNGEIYNHKELRKKLEKSGIDFKTTSDTEVIVRAIEKWGISAIRKFNGCFAFALLDKKNKKLYLARDPLGKKQIVYTKAKNGDWVFASEAKALLKHPNIISEPNIDRFISDLVFKFFSDKKETYFKNIFYIPAGHYFVFDLIKSVNPRIVKYWDIDSRAIINYSENNVGELAENFYELLNDSVRLRMDADTEIGAILSGGIDSSFITKMASKFHNRKYKKPFQCFTIKYDCGSNKDLKNSKMLCQSLDNVLLREIEVDENVRIAEIDEITFSLEEPLLDKVFVSQYLNYKTVKEHNLRAVINGQGADELWLGYLFFYNLLRLPEKDINIRGIRKYFLENFKFLKFIKSKEVKKKLFEIIETNLKENFAPYKCSKDSLEALVNFSIKTHLQSMFIQEDRLSMANSIEVRLPHVDPRLVKLALSIPSRIKIFDRREKYIPRLAAKISKFLPKEIYSRRKMAFPDPPNKYDRHFEAIFNKKEVMQSKIIAEIFQGNQNNFFYDLSIRDRWILLAISRMEKVFFDN